MQTFNLVFKNDNLGVAKKVEFKGQTAASAFKVLEVERDARLAELWCDGEQLAEIVRDRSGVWQINAGHMTRN